MRFLALTLLAAAASAETLKLGYGLGNGDLQFDLATGTKYGTKVYSLAVPAFSWFNGNSGVNPDNWFLSVRLALSVADCLTCAEQTIDLNYRIGGTTASAADTALLTKQGGTALSTSGIWADIPLKGITGEPTINFFVNVTCPKCSKTAELSRLEAIIRNIDQSVMTNPPVVFGSFDRDNDRNTDYYSGPVGSWGPVVRVQNIAASDYVIVLQDIATTSSGAGIVYYFSTNQTGFAAGLSMYDASTQTCAMPAPAAGCSSVAIFVQPAATAFTRAPAGAYQSGEFAATPTYLGQKGTGTWYVAPFITKKSVGTATPQFRFAIGLNAVPAAAAGLVPSFIVVALATVFAALRV